MVLLDVVRVCQTNSTTDPWLRIELPHESRVDWVRVFNRGGGFEHRLAKYQVWVSKCCGSWLEMFEQDVT